MKPIGPGEMFLMRYWPKLMKFLITGMILGNLFLFAGCSAMKPQTTGEWAFHAANLADTLQTINHGSDPCYVEDDPVARSILGEHPDSGETVALMLGISAFHRFVSWEMQRNDVPMWVQNTFNAVTFTTKAYHVVDNHRNGVRPWGDNQPVRGCIQ